MSFESLSGSNVERIEKGVLVPNIFVPYQDKLGVGLSTKQLGENRLKDSRVMGQQQRFDYSQYEDLSKHVGAARVLVDTLKVIYPEENNPTNLLRKAVKTKLVHGTEIVCVDDSFLTEVLVDRAGKVGVEADALITNLVDVPLITLAADCAPVTIYDPVNRVVSSIHSGRKGTLGDISGKVVDKMTEVYGSLVEDLLVYIGPYAGIGTNQTREDSYEVDQKIYDEVTSMTNKEGENLFSASQLEELFIPNKEKPGHYFFDYGKIIKWFLLDKGVRNIEVSNFRTKEDNDLFPSAQVEGDERGTFFSLAVLK